MLTKSDDQHKFAFMSSKVLGRAKLFVAYFIVCSSGGQPIGQKYREADCISTHETVGSPTVECANLKKWKLKVLEDRMNLSFRVKLGVHHNSVKPLILCCSKKQFLKSVKNLFTVGLFCIGGIYACEEN